MQIDWLTVVAQIVNFLVLVLILKRFLYAPVLAAMARREARIVDRLDKASEREAAASAARERLDTRLAELDQDRHAMLAQARDDVARRRDEMLDEVRREVETSRSDWRNDLERERERERDRMRSAIADCGIAAARTLLQECAGARLDRRMVERLVERLEDFDLGALRDACEASGELRVRSAFEVDDAERSSIARVLHEHLAQGLKIDYEVVPSLLAGIELTGGGLSIGWTLSEQLLKVEGQLDKRLGSGIGAELAREAEPASE